MSEDTSALDRSVKSVLTLLALPPHDKSPDAITLMASCGKEYSAIILPHSQIDDDFVQMRYRFDDGPIKEDRWPVGRGNPVKIPAKDFLTRMAGAKRFAIEIPRTGESAAFDVSGLGAQLKSLPGNCNAL